MQNRRGFLAGLFGCAPLAAKSRPDAGRVPTDHDVLNAFVGKYNLYVTRLQRGIIDVKQWGAVRAAWLGMTA